MRIGIDFDNTIICYDSVFCDLAKTWQMIPPDFHGSKAQLRYTVQALPEGDVGWQRLQGKVYGELIHQAIPFPGFKEFIAACSARSEIEIYIVSHKTEFGHFDKNRINLRDVSRQWLNQQGFFNAGTPHLEVRNVYFESTREDKIARIKTLQCTHFIDDLIEVLDSPLFPPQVNRILFQPLQEANGQYSKTAAQNAHTTTISNIFSNWTDITNALFS